MKVLVVGSGGREHALAWKLAASPRVSGLLCAPGNAGTARVAENAAIPASDLDGLVRHAKDRAVDLAVIGPDDALAAGLADAFAAAGIRVFGPSASAARLESSKSFAKDFMRRHGIPCADSRSFDDLGEAVAHCHSLKGSIVVKADGLALGKGVTVAADAHEAEAAVRRAMVQNAFGEAGRRVLIEEFLEGRECSIHAAVDASGLCVFPDARDHKRAFEGDQGPNTGGMGTVSPSGSLDDGLWQRVHSEILERFVAGLRADGLVFRGMLFPGLMLTASGPKVLEFNCRFGDTETQVLLRRLESDLLDILEACATDRLASVRPKWSSSVACCVVVASGGYPGPIETGKPVHGLEEAASIPGVEIFHAGTRREGDRLVTSGGRVLGVTALAHDLPTARSRALRAAEHIRFDGARFRKDIAL